MARSPTSVCAYQSGISSLSVTCASGAYCGYDSYYNAIGCCAGAYNIGRSYSLTGCGYYTSCIPNLLTDLFLNYQPGDLLCTGLASPYCGKHTYTDEGYARLFCAEFPTTIEVALTAEDTSVEDSTTVPNPASSLTFRPTPLTTASLTSSRSSRTASSTATSSSIPVPDGGGGGGDNPSTETQGSGGPDVGALGTPTPVSGGGRKMVMGRGLLLGMAGCWWVVFGF